MPLPVIVHLLRHHLENVTAQCTEECQFPQLVKIYSLVSDYDGRVHEPSTSVDCLILFMPVAFSSASFSKCELWQGAMPGGVGWGGGGWGAQKLKIHFETESF